MVIGGASLFGGRGSMLGTILGVLLIGVINNGLTLHNVEPFWVQFIQGAVIFLAVLFDSLNNKRKSSVLTRTRRSRQVLSNPAVPRARRRTATFRPRWRRATQERRMKYRTLGRSGLKVSVLTMGTFTFGGQGDFAMTGSQGVPEAQRLIGACRDGGINLFDTSNMYSLGLSEEILGEALGESRNDVLISSKARMKHRRRPQR